MHSNVKLGKSNIRINPVGLGTNAVGGHNLYPNLDEGQGKALVHAALDAGINFLDTAFIYGIGRSEELIGEVLTARGDRDKVIIATKGAHQFVDGQVVMNNNPVFIREQLENSLKRLKTDYIDLYYLHYPDKETPKAEAVGALQKMREEGKIRAIGVSNFSAEQLKEADSDGYVDVVQDRYNLFQREAEVTLLPYTREHNISFIPFFPLASGLLAGKYSNATRFDDGDIRLKNPLFQGDAFKQNLEKVELLKSIAAEKGAEVAHLVLALCLKIPGVDAVIPGAKNPAQPVENLKALEVELSDSDIERILQAF